MQIEQIDRDAAADIAQWHFPNTPGVGDGIRAGQYDDGENVQIMARHRLASLSARPAVGEDVVERVVDAVIDAANIVSHDGYYEIDRDAATRAAIAAMGSADMGKGGEG